MNGIDNLDFGALEMRRLHLPIPPSIPSSIHPSIQTDRLDEIGRRLNIFWWDQSPLTSHAPVVCEPNSNLILSNRLTHFTQSSGLHPKQLAKASECQGVHACTSCLPEFRVPNRSRWWTRQPVTLLLRQMTMMTMTTTTSSCLCCHLFLHLLKIAQRSLSPTSVAKRPDLKLASTNIAFHFHLFSNWCGQFLLSPSDTRANPYHMPKVCGTGANEWYI